MDPKYLENLNDTELADLFTLMCEAHQIMKNVVARTGEDRFCNEMYVSTMMNELAVFEATRRREVAKTRQGD